MLVPGGQSDYLILQSAAVATGNGTAVSVGGGTDGGFTVLGLQVVGITTATITVEGTIDGTNWVALMVENLNSGAKATTITANGIYRLVCSGLCQVRARISAWTSGTIYVTGLRVA